MQRVEMEELRQREANLTALNAIGPRKKPKLEPGLSPSLQVSYIFETKIMVRMLSLIFLNIKVFLYYWHLKLNYSTFI
jgi:hypothetical protein